MTLPKVSPLIEAKFGWPLLTALNVAPLIMWLFMQPLGDRFGNTYLVLTTIGNLTGIAAVVFYCYNLILTTRLRFAENLFGGLNKMFIAHHLIGGLALFMAIVHSTALTLRLTSVSVNEAAKLAVPFTTNWATTFGVLALWAFIALMLLTFYISLPYRIWLITHKTLGAVFLLIVLHVMFISSDLSTNRLLKYYLYGLFILAGVSYIYRTLLPRFFARRFKYEVLYAKPAGPNTVRITMVPVGRAIDFKAGQFIFVSFTASGVSKEWHPFTVSSNSGQGGLSVTVKGLGKYTNSLVKLAQNMTGATVWVEGAYGRFSFRNFRSKHQIWIAGGIGITPFLSMLPEVRPDYKIDLYYSVKTETELMDIPIMRQWIADSQGSLKVIPVVSDKDGMLTADKIVGLTGDLSDCEILLCGPPPMMHALRDQLKAKGLKKRYIHSEEFALT